MKIYLLMGLFTVFTLCSMERDKNSRIISFKTRNDFYNHDDSFKPRHQMGEITQEIVKFYIQKTGVESVREQISKSLEPYYYIDEKMVPPVYEYIYSPCLKIKIEVKELEDSLRKKISNKIVESQKALNKPSKKGPRACCVFDPKKNYIDPGTRYFPIGTLKVVSMIYDKQALIEMLDQNTSK